MNIKYFREEVSEEEALTTAGDDIETDVPVHTCFRTVRETMEELAYRTAVTYTDNDRPSLFYQTTLKGISCYEIGTRSNNVEQMPLSGEESRLHGVERTGVLLCDAQGG